jgi:hypothetical protein
VGLIVGVTLVSAGVILFVMLPVLRGDWAPLESTEKEITEVEARKNAALRGLRDAEYDFRAGKLDQADYEGLKSDLSRQALEAIQEESAGGQGEDRHQGGPTDAAGRPANGGVPGGAHQDVNDRLEAEIALVRAGIAEGRTCPGCGHLNVEKSRFCTSCGSPLGEAIGIAGDPASD